MLPGELLYSTEILVFNVGSAHNTVARIHGFQM